MGPDTVKRKLKPNGHFIANRKTEIWLGVMLFIVGSFLLWDAYDGRGRTAAWPISTIFPW